MSASTPPPTALIAEDEPLLAQALQEILRETWPELRVIALATDGVAAVTQALEHTPDVLFLDIKMPGRTGLEVAEIVADEWGEDRSEPLFVFVTAYDEFAVSAFEKAAVDYLLKPATSQRLEMTVARLKQRLGQRAPVPAAGDMAARFQQLQSISGGAESKEKIRIIRASVGATVRMIPVAEVICLEAADKYVNVVTAQGAALVRMSLRDLAARLDGVELLQVHRSAMVNVRCMASATRDELGHMTLKLRGTDHTLKVSRAFAHLFRPM